MLRSGNVRTRHFLSYHFLVSFVIALSFLIPGCAGEPRHFTWSNATGAEQHERLLWQAIQSRDWSNVERSLSPTFIGVNADGKLFDREGWVLMLKSAQVVEVSLGEPQIHPEGPDMKVTFVLHVHASGIGPAPAGLRLVSVWQQLKTRWLLSATSITPIQNN
jgi:Domain of unknown function (DUF4440)